MTSINPINVNTQGIGAKIGFGAQPKQEKEAEKQPEVQPCVEQKSVSPDQVFNYLSASANSVAASVVSKGQTLDPSKYVDEASRARIASFMGSFEDKVAEGLKAFDKEFSGVSVSDATKMNIVLKQIDKES